MDELKNKTDIAMKQITRRITGTLSLAFLTCAVFGGSHANADSSYTPVLDYNEMPFDEQYTVVSSVLSKIYEHYSVREPDKAVADCIIDLFNNPDRETNGYDHFGVALQVAIRHERPENYTVESILLGIVNSQCRAPSDE